MTKKKATRRSRKHPKSKPASLLSTLTKHISGQTREYLSQEWDRALSSILSSPTVQSIKTMLSYWHAGEGADEFGLDPTLVEFMRPFFQFLYYNYFRVDVAGMRNIPRKGPAILVANHAGALPYDGAMVHLAVFNNLAGQRGVRFLVEDFVYELPILGTFIQRIGGARASQENATKLLDAGHLIAVFPEGVRGIGKEYDERYKLVRFGRGGFVKLAMRTGVPIIPVSIVGSEETHPIIWKSYRWAEPLGLPFIPFTPTFPWLGPLGLVPLPSKWNITFGKVRKFDGFEPIDAEDEELVNEHADSIKEEIQNTLNKMLAKRKNIWI
ncbi:MAG: lysophospholipid acyltransferase family protein [Pseudomonadota bacterium]